LWLAGFGPARTSLTPTASESTRLADEARKRKPAAANFLQQQAKFDRLIEEFYQERPHEALGIKCPAEVYQPSTRTYKGLPDCGTRSLIINP
jgi:hypothetical protein